ncbi:MAG: ATP-dependent DNA helicase [Pseudomonadota bacterium]
MKTSVATTQKTLTPAQKKAIEATQEWVGIIAGAGSGKTTVLIQRCLNIIKNNPDLLNNFLIITFTEKAAGELLERLRKHLPPNSQHVLVNAWIGTFHSFCAKILRQNAALLDLDPNFRILDENQMHLLGQQVCTSTLLGLLDEKDEQALLLIEEMDFKHALGLFTDLCAFRWHTRQILNLPAKGSKHEIKIKQAIKHCYLRIEQNILASLRAKEALDFQQLEINALHLLTSFPKIRAFYQKKFAHILVDEFQDTNDLQSELIFTLASPTQNFLAIVGDPHQSIYRFRGANVNCFEQALKKIQENNGQIISLTDNFRSEPEIVYFANSLFNFHQLNPARPDAKNAKAVQTMLFTNPEKSLGAARQKEALALVEQINNLVNKQGYKYSDIACLFQAMTNLHEYETSFKKHNIPYRFLGGKGLLEKRETNDLINLLTYVVNPQSKPALLGLLRSPFIGFSDEECLHFCQNQQSDQRLRILDFLKQASLHLRPSEILEQAIQKTGYDLICDKLDASGSMTANLERIIGLAKSFEQSGPITLETFVSFLNEMKAKNAHLGDPTVSAFGTDVISCLTVHAAKGLEFPIVILPDLLRKKSANANPWRFVRNKGLEVKLKNPVQPFAERQETTAFRELKEVDLAEEEQELQRLLYVAITRAKDRLIIPIHHGQKPSGKWQEWLALPTEKSSITILNPGQDLSKQDKSLQLKLNNISMAATEPVTSFTPSFFTVSELECYERCPHEYFLKYHLGLPAEDFFSRKPDLLPANIKGSIIHSIIQKYEPSLKTHLQDLIKAECINSNINPVSKIIKVIEKPVLTFLKNPLAKNINSGQRELHFDWKFNDSIITGTIDWLKPGKSGFEIIDFKTDHITDKEVEKSSQEYELQLATYALALNISETKLYFLEPDIIWPLTIDDVWAKKYKSKLEKIINNIKQEKFEVVVKQPPCFKCPYHRNKICKKGRD